MREIRIEVATEYEAIEFCNTNGYEFIKCYYGKGSNTGKLMLLAKDPNSPQMSYEDADIPIEEKKDSIVFATLSTGRMYVADRSKCASATTFSINQAKLFKYSQAFEKAKHMCKNGSYSWRALRIK